MFFKCLFVFSMCFVFSRIYFFLFLSLFSCNTEFACVNGWTEVLTRPSECFQRTGLLGVSIVKVRDEVDGMF